MSLRKPQIAVLIYACYLLVASLLFIDQNNASAYFLLAPWSIVGIFNEEFFNPLLFGFMGVYILNSTVIYYSFARKSPQSTFRMPFIIAIGSIPWALILLWYGATCSDDWCSLLALPALIPFGFLVGYFGIEVLEEVFSIPFSLLANFVGVFLLLLIMQSIARFIKRLINRILGR